MPTSRRRTPIGTFGEIYFEKAPGGRARAFARFHDHDGQLRRVQATGSTQKAAQRKLKDLLGERAEQGVGRGELTAISSFRQLVNVWLADLELENKPALSTRALCGRNMRQPVMPAFEHYPLEENHEAPGRPVHQDARRVNACVGTVDLTVFPALRADGCQRGRCRDGHDTEQHGHEEDAGALG